MIRNFYLFKVFLFSAALCFSINGLSQKLYDIQPICNVEGKLKQYFNDHKIRDSIVYVIHLKPNSCPRCEGVLLETIKRINSKQTCLIVDSKSFNAATSYVKENNFSALFRDIIIDTIGQFRQFTNYDKTELKAPYLYKINIKAGFFNAIIPSLGLDVTDSLIMSLRKKNEKISCLPAKRKQTIAERPNSFWDKKVQLPNNPALPFDEPIAIQFDKGLLSFIDYSSNRVFVFDTAAKEIALLDNNDSEFYVYANTDFERSMVRNLKQQKILKVIYVNQHISPKQKQGVAIVASLPKIVISINGADTNVDYFNIPVIITKSFSNENISIDTLDYQSEHGLLFSHQQYKEILDNRIYGLKVKKGFPAVGTAFNAADSNNNPFTDTFYKNAPLIRLVDKKNNKALGCLGQLPEMYRKRKLGYYFWDAKFDANDSLLYIYSEFSGEIQIFKISDILKGNFTYKTCQVFAGKDKELPYLNADNYANKLDYMIAYKSYLLGSLIHRLVITDSGVMIIVFDKKRGKILVKEYNSDLSVLKRTAERKVSNFSFKYVTIIPKGKKDLGYELFGIEEEHKKYYMCWDKLD